MPQYFSSSHQITRRFNRWMQQFVIGPIGDMLANPTVGGRYLWCQNDRLSRDGFSFGIKGHPTHSQVEGLGCDQKLYRHNIRDTLCRFEQHSS
jgi:hypothetical protein